ncbi:MAG: hypothetical protein IJ449_09700 [Clostridia bacterium]|nr:hypothetical protein [Clostridia bacterium]
MTWEILTGLITLGGALCGFAKTIANNTRAMTELRCTVSALHEASEAQRGELTELRHGMQALEARLTELEYTVKVRGCEFD